MVQVSVGGVEYSFSGPGVEVADLWLPASQAVLTATLDAGPDAEASAVVEAAETRLRLVPGLPSVTEDRMRTPYDGLQGTAAAVKSLEQRSVPAFKINICAWGNPR